MVVMSKATKRHLRLLAIQLAGQLPEDQEAALEVIEMVRELVVDFMDRDDKKKPNIHALKP